jgi:hypothetical protein
MKCFVSLVENRFLKKATKQLTTARNLLLQDTSTADNTKLNIVRWSFLRKDKRRQFNIVWRAFEMDRYLYEGSDFLLDDYISIVEDDDVAIMCSVDKKLVNESVLHYHNVHGDWCYFRTRKRIANKYVHVAVMWRAFPTIPFSLN